MRAPIEKLSEIRDFDRAGRIDAQVPPPVADDEVRKRAEHDAARARPGAALAETVSDGECITVIGEGRRQVGVGQAGEQRVLASRQLNREIVIRVVRTDRTADGRGGRFDRCHSRERAKLVMFERKRQDAAPRDVWIVGHRSGASGARVVHTRPPVKTPRICEVVAALHHRPSPRVRRTGRRRTEVQNDLGPTPERRIRIV